VVAPDLVALLAMFIGLVIFMTFALDRPFRGIWEYDQIPIN
jgi:hypothetical protein